jgi:hypothetical protein
MDPNTAFAPVDPAPKLDEFFANDLVTKVSTNTDTTNDFIGSVVGLQSHTTLGPDSSPSAEIMKARENIKNTPSSLLNDSLRSQTKASLLDGYEQYRAQQAQQYGATGDQAAVDRTVEAKKIVDEAPTKSIGENLTSAYLMLVGQEPDKYKKEQLAASVSAVIYQDYMAAHPSSTVQNFLGMLVPFRASAGEALHGVTPGQVSAAAENFHNLPPEERVRQIGPIIDQIYKASGNNKFVADDYIRAFLDPADAEAAKVVLGTDVVNAALMVPFGKFLRMAQAMSTPIKVARAAGDLKAAARLAAEAVMDGTGNAAKAAGISLLDAAASTLPFKGEAAIPEITNGISDKAQAIISDALTKSRAHLNTIIFGQDTAWMARGALNPADAAAAVEKFKSQFVGNVEVSNVGEMGFDYTVTTHVETPTPALGLVYVNQKLESVNATIETLRTLAGEMRDSWGEAAYTRPEYTRLTEKLADYKGQARQLEQSLSDLSAPKLPDVQTGTVRFTKSDIGKMEATVYKNANTFISSADTIIGQMQRGAVSTASVIELTQRQIRDYFNYAMKPFGGVSKREIKELNDILHQGQLQGVGRYSTEQLTLGIETPNGVVRLKSAEQVARYHIARDINDTAFLLNNRKVRDSLLFNKYNHAVTVNTPSGPMLNYIRQSDQLASLPDNVSELYDFATGKVIQVGSRDIINARIANRGWRLYETKLPIEAGERRSVGYVLARDSDLKSLPDVVLNYKPGYNAQIYKDVFAVAVEHVPQVVNGEKVIVPEIRRFFNNTTDAKKFTEMELAAGKKTEWRPGKEFLDSFPNLKDTYEEKVFGGLGTGRSTDTFIPYGLEGTPAQWISPLEAMDKAVNNVSTQIPINNFRMGWIQRFLNSAKNDVTGKSYLTNPGDWQSPIVAAPDVKAGLQATQRWMQDVFRIQTKEEKSWQQVMYRVGMFLDGEKLNGIGMTNKLRKWAMSSADKDVFAAARTTAFHALLGWLNPRQLYVQAAGAAAAMSINPEMAPILLPRYMALRAVMYGDVKELNMMARNAVAKATGFMNQHNFDEMVRAYRMSGIRDSIISTADFDAAIKGMNIGASAIRRASDKGLFFLRESELFNRSYNWLLAHSKFMKDKPAGYIITNQDVDAITKEGLRVGMNLMRSNRAGFQKGFWSIPFQFQQISTKFIGNMMYSMKSGAGNWTAMEKAKIGIGQLALFGAAGVPFGAMLAKDLVSWAKDKGDHGLGVEDPAAIAAIRGGFSEWLLQNEIGQPVDISASMSYAGNIESLVNNVIGQDAWIGKILAGAAGEVPTRAYKAILKISSMFAVDSNPNVGWDEKDATDALLELATVVSSWRNINKARLWERSGVLFNEHGQVIREIDPVKDHNLLMAQALGLAPSELKDLHDIKTFNKRVDKDIQDVAESWVQLALLKANDPRSNEPAQVERTAKQIGWLVAGLTEAEKKKVAELVSERLKFNKYQVIEQMKKAIENQTMTEGNTPEIELNYTMEPKKQ